MGTVMEAVKRAVVHAGEEREVTPLDELSKPALRALVKLLVSRRVLSVSNPTPYVELWNGGWAYRVASVPNGFVVNDDNMPQIKRMLHLA